MNCKAIEHKLNAGGRVYYFNLYPNSDGVCSFACISEEDMIEFAIKLDKLVKEFTVEELNELR